MKWFKHISDSLDDPFIYDLIKKFGANGYLLFFGILEIYAREFKPDEGWRLEVSIPYVCSKLFQGEWQVTHRLVPGFLQVMSKSGKWDITITELRTKKDGEEVPYKVSIFIKKFTELIDEWSRRKLGSKRRVTPKILKTDTEEDTDTELYKDKDIYIKHIARNGFARFWQVYPNKKSKGDAEKAFKTLRPDEQLLATMIAKIGQAKKSDQWVRDSGKYIPYPATWIRAKGWEDEYRPADATGSTSNIQARGYNQQGQQRGFGRQPAELPTDILADLAEVNRKFSEKSSN